MSRDFDLNIEKILEGWNVSHAVREIIANALDEQALTGTKDVTILRDSGGAWHVRDCGRGLTYRHLTENENDEKRQRQDSVIGKFGVGLKDALATLHRNGVKVQIESKHGRITLSKRTKHGFDDVITLNAVVDPPQDREFVGTDVTFTGLSGQDVDAAKDFFLRFSGEQVLEETRFGQILRRRPSRNARIYFNGLVAAEEEGFLFSYNVTSLTASMRKALNRERMNVGRTAYSDRIKTLLLTSKSQVVAEALADDLAKVQQGTNHDEVIWTEVAIHAAKILNASGKIVFVGSTSSEMEANRDPIDHAIAGGNRIIAVPEKVKQGLRGLTDTMGHPVRDLEVYRQEWSEGFKYKFIEEVDLTSGERNVLQSRDQIARAIGGFPASVKGIRISETMRPDFASTGDALGCWESGTGRIIIKRSQLRSVDAFTGTLLHELTHAATGSADLTRSFEQGLTEMLGKVYASQQTGKTSAGEKPSTVTGPRLAATFALFVGFATFAVSWKIHAVDGQSAGSLLMLLGLLFLVISSFQRRAR